MRRLKLWILHHPHLTRFIIDEFVCLILFAIAIGTYHFFINPFTLKEIVFLFAGYHLMLYILGS